MHGFKPVMNRHLLFISILILAGVLSISGQNPAASPNPVRPLSIGIVVDNSGSYRTIFERVMTATNAVIQDLRPGDEAFLVTFVDTSKISLRQEMTSDGQELRDAAENMFIQGGSTSILDSVVFAAKYMGSQGSAEGDRSRVLVLITDGDERGSAASVEEAVKAARDAGLRIFILGLHEEKFYSKIADRLTRDTGGAKFVPKVPKESAAMVSSLLSAIRAK